MLTNIGTCGTRIYRRIIRNVFYVLCNIWWLDGIKNSPTRSDFPPHQLATINSPNLRPRAAINYAARPLPPISSSPPGSSSVPSSPATRKSSSVLGRFKAKITDVDRHHGTIVVGEPETLDTGAYTPLLPVTGNSLPNSPGSRRQKLIDAPPIGIRQNCALPRMTSTKTQTGASLSRAADSKSGNSTSGVTTVDMPRTRLARPSTLIQAVATTSVQRRRLPSPPRDHDGANDVDHRKRRPDAIAGAVTASPRVTSGRCKGTYMYLPRLGPANDPVRISNSQIRSQRIFCVVYRFTV